MDRKSRLAPVTCSSMGGDGMPGRKTTDGFQPFFPTLNISKEWLVFPGLTCWVFNGEDLSWFAGMTNAGLVLSTDLELNLGSLDNIRHSVFTVWAGGLPTFHPASTKFLLLLNGIPKVQKCKTVNTDFQHTDLLLPY